MFCGKVKTEIDSVRQELSHYQQLMGATDVVQAVSRLT